ncbi:MAG: RNA polymerase sigma-54 factor, partial [Prosthecochloris sp.]|nr:RNA polymerase sigma-54 factor [Prosthecochloris sp.]
MPDFKLQQSQRAQLSAQQILSSQLLQLPLLNLEQRIYDELQENPLLELIEEKNESVDETGEQSGDDGDDGDGEGMFDSVDRFEARDEKRPEKNEQPKESQEGVLHFTVDTTPKENFIQAIQQDSFEERMLRDLSLREEIGSTELLIASEILGNLDDDGYLQDGLDIVADGLLTNHGVDVEPRDIQRVLHIIQRMDPPGIAVASLRERLLVQLELNQAASGSGGAAIIAKKLLDSYFDDFLNNRYEKIIKRMQIRPEQLEAAIKEIAALDPHPFVVYQDTGDYIMPDFIVTYENGRLTAALNDRSNLSVQVSDAYR